VLYIQARGTFSTSVKAQKPVIVNSRHQLQKHTNEKDSTVKLRVLQAKE
jgi:hypothetical protein